MIDVSRMVRLASAVAALGVAMALPASAGRDGPREDPAVVAERLRHMGFVEWRDVRWSHGYWKVNNAKRANGHVYDLEIESGSFDLVRLRRERG
ncbi:hypothetical protein [Hyphomicrobium sp.]|uniref:hypothetical protein n=1 Tax=Hyphomicrobium sp. TaxID=82 RepID=UPI000FA7CEA4|nr:hypothetical protein [Hyphomicrobium sp.]MBN9247064.1 hypothetical protein [Hyphomicrobium sp.]RUP10608.1 MAG: hypothetical protein EKK38_03555 [Hyphomicrobium sp.]